jgi:8-oxo-dGTP pyrophosphatase MutT (NUDIX family)
MKKAILTGKWDDNQSWTLFRDDTIPNPALCTAVYCLAILPATEQVVLTRNNRGWEMLGGHIEKGEMIEEALVRECLEEGGYVPENYQLFGYRKITAKKPVPHNQDKDSFYPFPNGYIPHFIATSSLPLHAHSGTEIYERRAFSFDELESLTIEQLPLLKNMLQFYEHQLSQTRIKITGCIKQKVPGNKSWNFL